MILSITKHIPGSLPPVFFETVPHPEFSRALNQIWTTILDPGPIRLLFVTGPTGSGKTAMASGIAERLTEFHAKDETRDPEHLLYAHCAIKAPGPHAFSWKYTYQQLLRSLGYRFGDNPAGLIQPRRRDEQMRFLPDPAQTIRTRMPIDLIYGALLNAIAWRAPKVIILDEAQHLARIKTQESLRQQLSHIKHLADEARTLFVLFSTYELAQLASFDGQILRRSQMVELRRYIYRENLAHPTESLHGFALAVKGFMGLLGNRVAFDLLDHVPMLYGGTIGCIGLLRDWLGRAWVHGVEHGKGTITLASLRATILPARSLVQLLDEAQAGEALFAPDDQTNELWERLGLPVASDQQPTVEQSPPVKRGRVGRRRPHSDPVGFDQVSAINHRL